MEVNIEPYKIFIRRNPSTSRKYESKDDCSSQGVDQKNMKISMDKKASDSQLKQQQPQQYRSSPEYKLDQDTLETKRSG